MPDIVREAIGAAVQAETMLDAQIEDALSESSGSAGRSAILWTVVVASFLYGVVHALGPGHGKVAVSAYLASHRARMIHAAALGTWTALVQSASAILLVAGLGWLLHVSSGPLMTDVGNMEVASYATMCLVGLWTIWAVATRRDCCDDRPQIRLSSLPARDENHEGIYLASARKGTGRSRVLPSERSASWVVREILATGIGAGVRPCTGAVFVLLSAQGNGAFATGVVSTLAMGAGVAATVTTVAAISLGVNRVLSERAMRRRRSIARTRRAVALLGAAFIAIFGIVQCVGLASGWIPYTLT
ncbi:hypothetical protein IQ289_31310 [Burkholderia sp. R-70006]|uniref:nickel/cobalt transporter n=1 Tax=Paraburkholderia domus TaxID=2793075 RepID=UPI00191176E1|nr:hypothetical protein [Paraburkholderia domus]MBK5052873.1 hypothetical protein [Burkholderia sp. R-70006]